MILLQIDHSEHLPQVPELVSHSMLFVAGFFEDVSSFWRLQLKQVSEKPNRYSAKHHVEPPSDLSESEVDHEKHVGAYHANFVDYQESHILEQGPLHSPRPLRQAHVGGPELEGERCVQGLPVNVAGCCARETRQKNVGAVRVVPRLLQGVCHHVVDGRDQS